MKGLDCAHLLSETLCPHHPEQHKNNKMEDGDSSINSESKKEQLFIHSCLTLSLDIIILVGLVPFKWATLLFVLE